MFAGKFRKALGGQRAAECACDEALNAFLYDNALILLCHDCQLIDKRASAPPHLPFPSTHDSSIAPGREPSKL